MGLEIGLSLFVGLVCGVLGCAVDQDSRPKRAIMAFTTGLLGFVITWIVYLRVEVNEISETINTLSSIERIPNPLMKAQGQKAYSEFQYTLASIKRNEVEIDNEADMMSLYYTIFEDEQPGGTIDATSLVSIPKVWERARGNRALEANERALKNGIKIRRTFIFDSEEIKNASLEYLQKQAAMGIDVYVVMTDVLDQDLRRDFVITSSDTVLEFITDSEGGLAQAKLIRNSEKVGLYRKRMEEILAAADKQ